MADHNLTSTTLPLNGEKLISLSDAAAPIPGNRGAKRLHPATLTRWIIKGALALDGRRVRLEATRLGNRWLTSAESLARFSAALAIPADETATPTPRSPTASRRASAAAGRELERRGA